VFPPHTSEFLKRNLIPYSTNSLICRNCGTDACLFSL